MKFIITVDTEADNQWKGKGKPIKVENINFIPRFHALCKKYNFEPTYLVTYEIVSNNKAVKILKNWQDNGEAEIGAHLHPWTTPPFKKGEVFGEFPSNLSNSELCDKLKELTELIERKFNNSPTSFRAGRWGLDERIVKCLQSLNYEVDCSVTPKISWKSNKWNVDMKDGPDFRKANIFPYYFSNNDVTKEDDEGLLSLPMTIIYRSIFAKENSYLAKVFTMMPDSFFKKVLNKLFFKLTWCRIQNNTTPRKLYSLYRYAKKNKMPYLEFMIHSSELMPGGSPMTKTEESVEMVYYNLEKFFRYLSNNNVQGVTLSEFAEKHMKNGIK